MTKKITALLLAFVFMLSLFGCAVGETELKSDIEIPENGIISSDVIEDAKNTKAILTFVGKSDGIEYEWTLFGRDVTQSCDINLKAEIFDVTETSFAVRLFNEKSIGFPIVMSVRLNGVWNTLSAVVYREDTAVCSATVTGTERSILNFTVTDLTGEYTVKAEAAENETAETTALPDESESVSVTLPVSSEKTTDEYITPPKQSSGRVYSDGKATERDKYKTDPVPEGKPMPVEPEERTTDSEKKLSCTFSIECSTILNNLDKLDSDKLEVLPSGGVIFAKQTVTFSEGESVFDVLQRVCRENGIHLESSWTPMYNSAYVEGINNLYEFDCGQLSGWMYRVNGWYPNYGCSRYALAEGDVVEWRYTCDYGRDVGCDWMAGTAE